VKEIAARLGIAESTVQYHQHSVAIKLARQHGLISDHDPQGAD